MQFWFLHWSLTFAFCCTYGFHLFFYHIRSYVVWAGLMMRGLFSSSFCNPVIMWNQESKYCILFKTILERLLKVAADEWNVKEQNCTKSIPCWIVRKGDFLKDLWKGAKKYRKAVRWCASVRLIRFIKLIRLIRLIKLIRLIRLILFTLILFILHIFRFDEIFD